MSHHFIVEDDLVDRFNSRDEMDGLPLTVSSVAVEVIQE
jgi:hypothetical protein